MRKMCPARLVLIHDEPLTAKCVSEGVSLYLERCWQEFKAGSGAAGQTARTGLAAAVNLMTCSSSTVGVRFL